MEQLNPVSGQRKKLKKVIEYNPMHVTVRFLRWSCFEFPPSPISVLQTQRDPSTISIHAKASEQCPDDLCQHYDDRRHRWFYQTIQIQAARLVAGHYESVSIARK